MSSSHNNDKNKAFTPQQLAQVLFQFSHLTPEVQQKVNRLAKTEQQPTPTSSPVGTPEQKSTHAYVKPKLSCYDNECEIKFKHLFYLQ